MREDCLRDIHNIGAGYKRPKDYCRTEFNAPDASCITDIKNMKQSGHCYKCGGPHFQHNCTDNIKKTVGTTCRQNTHTKITMETTTKTTFATVNNNMLQTGILSFQAPQPIRSGIYLSASTDEIKCFLGKLGQKHSFKKKSGSQH